MNTMIRVISLADATARRAAFAATAEGSGVDYAFFDAHRTPAPFLVNDVAEQTRLLGEPMQPGEVGCYSSHVAVWREFLDSGAAQLLVIEDDVVIDWPFVVFLSGFDFASGDIHYIRLFAKIWSPKLRLRSPFLTRYHGLFQNTDLALGTQAYLMTREAARTLSDHCRVIRRPIDLEMDRAWDHGVPNLEIVPSPLFERFAPSSIGDTRMGREDVSRWRPARIAEKGRKLAYQHFPRRAAVRTPRRFDEG